MNDLLAQVAEASVVVMATADGEEVVALPKREQTMEEMERTKQFAIEVGVFLLHLSCCSTVRILLRVFQVLSDPF